MEIIVVDDGSSDGTVSELSKFKSINLILHPKNRGKGAALRTGFKAAKGKVVIIQDADMEYSPSDIPRLLQAVGKCVRGKQDVVYTTLQELHHQKTILQKTLQICRSKNL